MSHLSSVVPFLVFCLAALTSSLVPPPGQRRGVRQGHPRPLAAGEEPFTEVTLPRVLAAAYAAADEERAEEERAASMMPETLAQRPEEQEELVGPGSLPSPGLEPRPATEDQAAGAWAEEERHSAPLGEWNLWEEVGGNFILRPPEGVAPRGVLHFLGGAFVGAAPHLTYRYLLAALAEEGYVVVATPFRLGFDYLEVCDEVLGRFDHAGVVLAKEYGALPVIGVGHSCGALLQVLISCLFPDTPRAANVLISFNNKPVKEAIPAFDELVVPVAGVAVAPESRQLWDTAARVRETMLRSTQSLGDSTLAPPVVRELVAPSLQQSFELVDQIPDLIEDIASGVTEFSPSPVETRESCRRMYRARRTLLLQFENDSLDESQELFDVLSEAKDIMRLKRPMIEFDIRLEKITGTHITPLTQDVFKPSPLDPLDLLSPLRSQARTNFLSTIQNVRGTVVDWLNEV